MTACAHLDCETYSEVDLRARGHYVYAAHESTDVLCAAYTLPGETEPRLWVPGGAPPEVLFHASTTIAAWNVSFEREVWNRVCVRRYGWPPLAVERTRCTMAAARAYGLPGALADAAAVLGTPQQKDPRGARLIAQHCRPRADGQRDLISDRADLHEYCRQDVRAEQSIGARVPALSPHERRVWLADQRCNDRGIAVDVHALSNAERVVELGRERVRAGLSAVTLGEVQSGSQVQAILAVLARRGMRLPDLTAETVERTLARDDIDPAARDILECRQRLASSSVAKLAAFRQYLGDDGRCRGMLRYHGAQTGRWTGGGPQPQNLPRGNAAVGECFFCSRYCGVSPDGRCRVCKHETRAASWGWGPSLQALVDFERPELVAAQWGDELAVVAGSLRALLIGSPALVAADYSAIEAVVLAALAGETWRLDVFRGDAKIYEATAAKILGKPVDAVTRGRGSSGRSPSWRPATAGAWARGSGSVRQWERRRSARPSSAGAPSLLRSCRGGANSSTRPCAQCCPATCSAAAAVWRTTVIAACCAACCPVGGRSTTTVRAWRTASCATAPSTATEVGSRRTSCRQSRATS